eukprot:TRINITY_DN9399_c0_g1_i1.p1 TRINITY_DN9399_c0_g1~~TRINITY_DN9399_c0_g1_i1.p1  ORF type:complete len:295 (-),score=98.77 TRINITY_DN9399_c0_g1_i1:140-1024(-)
MHSCGKLNIPLLLQFNKKLLVRNMSGYSALSVTVEEENNLGIMKFNRPKRYNSFISRQYSEVARALSEFEADDRVRVVLLTGSGKFYSSGHDLLEQSKDMMKVASDPNTDLRAFLTKLTWENAGLLIKSFIDFKKPIIVGVNGPAIGVAVTTLQLCDIIYCAESATFQTPFMQLGFNAEGCSSVLFPRVMGTSKANEMLLLGKKFTAEEAERCGFVSQVFPDETFHEDVLNIARKMAAFPPNALKDTKKLIKFNNEELHEINKRELDILVERFMSEECTTAIMNFMMNQQKKES